jgi:hypothetical protein
MIPDFSNTVLQQSLIRRMENTVKVFEDKLSEGLSSQELLSKRLTRPRPKMLQTVVVIPYTSIPASQFIDHKKREYVESTYKLRLLYLRACVLSISRFFPKIMITTQTVADMNAVKALDLPIWKYLDLSPMLASQKTLFLPRESLVYLFERLNESRHGILPKDSDWKDIEYIYYSEMDQILHARSLKISYDMLDHLNGSAILVPHRINVSIDVVSLYALHVLILCYRLMILQSRRLRFPKHIVKLMYGTMLRRKMHGIQPSYRSKFATALIRQAGSSSKLVLLPLYLG